MLNVTFLNLIQNALDTANLRQQVYANNIANENTPGFKQQSVQFESLLQQAMLTTPPANVWQKYIPISMSGHPLNIGAASQVSPRVVQDTSTTMSNNGNNVDIDAQMAGLAENQIK